MHTLVITFASTRHAITADRLCNDNGIDYRIIPVPKDISAQCGMAVETSDTFRAQCEALFTRAHLSYTVHVRDG
jgi:ribosomal protein L7Ae-like RNA K-turn-binding protein